ncbi:MAG: DinB family protein [Acidobacteriota bacterium]
MNYYGAKDIAASFRTVRNNTLKVAEDIPEEKYAFRAAEGTRTVAQILVHISNLHRFAFEIHRNNLRSTMEGFNFMAFLGPILASEQESFTKAQIIERLRTTGDEFENWVKTLSEDFLGQVVTMPPGGSPPSRNRFDMIISVKEHEMHHRGQLMLIERMLGITPHLTRAQQERIAAMQAAQAALAGAQA